MAMNSVLALGLGTLSIFLRLTAAETTTNDLATTPTLYVVNYSHLDDQWRWSYPQTIREFLPYTLHTNFRYFEKYPHHIFNFPGADRYRLIEEYYPEDFATLKTWVAKGRWVPNGNTWVENDTLAPSSETDIRQILMGYNYNKKHFGTEYTDFILPDSFGFPACLPSIIAHCGLRGFSTQKLTWKSAIGIPFNLGRWIGPDGRWVIAALNAGDYAKPHPTVYSTDKKMLERLEANKKASGLALDYIYNGRGDRGGAPYEISLKSMEQSYAQPGPVRVIVDQGDAMFRAISDVQAEKFPTYTGELLLTEHSTGTITSQAYMKRLNRLAELIGDASERASVAAELLGAAPYPTEALYSAWGLALRNQFHDAVPGTSVPKAYEYAWNDGIIALNQFGGVLNDAVGALARGLDTQVKGLPLVVFNPLSIAREDTIDLIVPPSLAQAADFTVFDAEGKALATQVTTGFDGERHVLFIGKLPAVGCAVFSLEETAQPLATELSITNDRLENSRYRVGIDADGDIASIFDKKAQRELLKEPIRLQIIENFPEKKPAWHIDWKDIIKAPRSIALKPSSIRIVDNGPVRVTIESVRECEGSLFIQRISLSAGIDRDRIDLSHRMDWKTTSAMLKQNFVFTVSNPIANYCGDLGTVQRGNRHEKLFEVPNHQWINLTDKSGDYGITLLTGAKYGSDKPSDDSIRLTLQHTPQTNDEENEKLDLGKAREQRWQDWGRHEFSYGIVGHAGDWRAGDATWQAHRFEHKSMVFTVPKHAGELGRQYSLMTFDNSQVVVQAIKRAENNSSIIIRLQECHGKPALGGTLSAVGAIQKATECDGLERPLQGLATENGALKLDFSPYQLRTIAVEIAPGKRVAAPASVALSLPFNCDIFSPNDKRDDGSFDLKRGDTYPAEMIGDTVSVGGINFKIGSRANGELNALSCDGQELAIPAGTQRLHLLVASEWKRDATFDFAGKKQKLSIADWGGYLGSWDNRIFIGEVQDLSYSIRNDLARIDPAWIRHDRVAWFASHYHTPPADMPYQYCYLFAYQLNVPEKAASFKLPKVPAIRMVAINAATVDNADIKPLWSWSSDLARDEAFKKRFSTP